MLGVPLDDMEEDFRILKMEVMAHIRGHTAGEVPLILLFACGELTDSELSGCVNSLPRDRNDHALLEAASRPVWVVGELQEEQTTTRCSVNIDGRPVILKPRWTFSAPEGWQWVVYNMSGSALTTGSTLQFLVKIYGVWVT